MKSVLRLANALIERLRLPGWEDGLLRTFLAQGPVAYRVAWVVLAVAVLVTMGMLFGFGCSHQWSCAWDSAFLLDGGWRVLGGQRPHVDFYSPLGAVPLLMTALGMVLAGPRGAALTYGYAVVFPLVTLLAWWIARRRLPAFHGLVFAAMVGFVLVATHYPGHPFHDTTYAAQYNRLGSALLGILLVETLLAPRGPLPRSAALMEGACAGAILALLLFTKITYFAMGVAAVIVGEGIGTIGLGAAGVAWSGMLGAFGLVWFTMLWYLGFDLSAFLADMKMLAEVQQPGQRLQSLANAVRWNRGSLGLLLAMAALLVRPMRDRPAGSGHAGWLRASATAAAAALIGLFIYSTDGISGLPPAFAVAALILSESFRRRCTVAERLAPESFEAGFKYLLAGALAACLAGVIVVHGSLSVAYSLGWHWLVAGRMPAAAFVKSSTMGDMILPPRPEEAGLDREAVVAAILQRDPQQPALTSYQYACWTNDGLALLRRHVNDRSRIFVMDWVNPFSFALELPSPRGGALYWHAGRVFDATHFPPAEQVFRDVTLVMVPKRAVQPASKRVLEQVYGPFLRARYRQIDKSELWVLYARDGIEQERSPP